MSSNMRVLMANKFFYPKGGAETVFFQERNWLLENGHDVADFSMHHDENVDSPYSRFFVPQVDYHNRGSAFDQLKAAIRFIHNGDATKRISDLCDEFKPQIAHLHNIYHQLTPSIIPTLKSKGVKVVLTIHDGKMICPSYTMTRNGKPCTACSGLRFWNAAMTNCKGSQAESLLLSLESLFHRFKGSYDKVDHIISPSQFLADLVVAAGYPAERISVVKNGIDANAFTLSTNDKGYALYYGRLSHEKGLNTLCAASKDFRIPLRVVGTGPLLGSLKDQYPDIQFDGHLSGQPLFEAIKNARCVVVPSEWYENCSMVVLESMATGKPVIGAHIGGIPEQILDEQTGYLFRSGDASELADCVNRLADDIDLAKELGFNARKRLEEHYSLERHFSNLNLVFREMLA